MGELIDSSNERNTRPTKYSSPRLSIGFFDCRVRAGWSLRPWEFKLKDPGVGALIDSSDEKCPECFRDPTKYPPRLSIAVFDCRVRTG